MKLKHIFMLLGAVLLGLTACSKDTPNTPDLSKTLAGTEWEATVRESDAGNKTVASTIVLKFVDGTKFTSQSTQQTIKNGAVVKTEVDDSEQGTYTYLDNIVTLITNEKGDNNKVITETITLTMDTAKRQLTGRVSNEESTTLTFVRKK